MPADPSPYWKPAANRTVGYRIGQICGAILVHLLFAYLAVALAQGIAHRMAGDSSGIVWLYGLGMAATRFIARWFLDLATSDKLGVMPGERVSQAIYILAIALRAAPHAVFLSWLGALMGAVERFPDPALFATLLVTLPMLSLGRLSRLPVVVIGGTVQLLLPRESTLYLAVAERLKHPGWIETVKFVRGETGLSARDAIMLITLVRNDAKSRTG